MTFKYIYEKKELKIYNCFLKQYKMNPNSDRINRINKNMFVFVYYGVSYIVEVLDDFVCPYNVYLIVYEPFDLDSTNSEIEKAFKQWISIK